jgi:hypothetical protein
VETKILHVVVKQMLCQSESNLRGTVDSSLHDDLSFRASSLNGHCPQLSLSKTQNMYF